MKKEEEPFNYNALPVLISQPAVPFVGFLGINIEKNSIHEQIWKAFSSKRPKMPMNYKLLDEDFRLPTQKPKKQSYEWCSPKGILKSNWVEKYTNQIPSLVVLFYEIDWDDSNWTEKRQDVIRKLDAVKTKFGDTRNIPRALVLLQASSLIAEEDASAPERAAGLCASASLPPKHLFVLPISDSHFAGYALRLENALHEIVCGFYNSQIKLVKSHQEFLNKTNQQLLFIRHQFKLGFYNEMRADCTTGIKHYEEAYTLLFEHKITNTNLHEVRMAAAIINYKICLLHFTMGIPRDAIKQFRRHVDMFRQKTGPQEIIFEHYGWTSEQYKMFGKVFEEAVTKGLPAVQTQNPGFYYQQAAFYGVMRRKIALETCKNISAPSVNLLEGWESLEFYGQRPWRQGKHILEPPERNMEADGNKALCYHEVNIWKHSLEILTLYMLAIVQFRKYNCPRIKRYLMVETSNEFIVNQEYSKALNMLKTITWHYRKEGWTSLLSRCLTLSLKCSYELASKSDYIESCLEILNERMTICESDRKLIQESFCILLTGQPPRTEDADRADTEDKWIESCRAPVTINMDNLLPAIQLKASFEKDISPMDEKLQILVEIRSLMGEAVQLQRLIVKISPGFKEVIESDAERLLLRPFSTLGVILTLQPTSHDVQQTLKICGVSVYIGNDSSVMLQWGGGGNQSVHPENITWKYKEFSLKQKLFEHDPLTELLITSRRSFLEVTLDYDATALVWEWLPVSVTLLNKETDVVSEVWINLDLQSSETSVQRTTLITTKANLENKLSTTNISNHWGKNMNFGEEKNFIFYVKSLNTSERSFKLEINYICTVEDGKCPVSYPVSKIEHLNIVAKIPFQVLTEAQSLKFDNITKISSGENFLVVPKIKCFSHVSITIVDSSLVLATDVAVVGESQSQVAATDLSDKEEATDCFCVASKTSGDLQLGQYLCYWKRLNGESPVVSVSFSLPKVTLEASDILVKARLPSNGQVKKPMTVSYEIVNVCSRMLEVTASIQVSDSFMYAGCKEVRMRLVANMAEVLSFNVYPLLVGFVQLPKLNITYDVTEHSNPISLAAYLARSIPTHIFIMPQERRHVADTLAMVDQQS